MGPTSAGLRIPPLDPVAIATDASKTVATVVVLAVAVTGAAWAAPPATTVKPAASARAAQAAAATSSKRVVKPAPVRPQARDTVVAAQLADLSPVLDSVRLASGVPAIVAAVVEGGRVIAAGASGAISSGSRAVRITDPFHVGPATKAMTATAIATLVDDGVLRWDLTLGEAFPDLSGVMDDRYAAVTLEQLLAHRGGIAAAEPDTALASAAPIEARRRVVAEVLAAAPRALAQGFHGDADAAYTVAAAIAERVSGVAWEELMRKRLFEPLHMRSAGLGWPATLARRDAPWGHRCDEEAREAMQLERDATARTLFASIDEQGHVWVEERVEAPVDIPLPGGVELEPSPCIPESPGEGERVGSALGPALDVHCSVLDLARFAAYHLRGAEPARGRPLLGPDNWSRMHTDIEGNYEGYGIGWSLAPFEDEPLALIQEGGAGPFYCRIVICPRQGRAVVVITNGGEPNGKAACAAGVDVVREWKGISLLTGKPETTSETLATAK